MVEKSKSSRLLIYQYKGIKEQAKEMQRELSSINEKRIEITSQNYGGSVTARISLDSMEREKDLEAETLLKSYNSSIAEVRNILGIELAKIVYKSNSSGVLLRQLIIECDKVIGFVEGLETGVSSEEMDKLVGIRKELTKAWTDLDINFEKNLDEAIKEAEKGH